MHLNTLKPAVGEKKNKTRVGRGIGSGLGKTCGRGHKGQTARSGYSRKIGFEGGQTPLQRRLPKFGFTSRAKDEVAEIRLSDLNKIDAEVINWEALKKAKLMKGKACRAKIILSGKIEKAVSVAGPDVKVSKGAKEAIEKAGGKVE